MAEKQSLEMPCVAPSLVGRPHRHTYFQSSRIAEASNWGPPQVLSFRDISLAGHSVSQKCDQASNCSTSFLTHL